MQGISKYLRLRATAVVAFVAAGLVLMAMCASASAGYKTGLKDISLGIRNSSKTPLQVQFCRNLLARENYEGGDPCLITSTRVLRAGERLIIPNGNPVGVIIRSAVPFLTGDKPKHALSFYARNEAFMRPYITMGPFKYPFSEGEALAFGVSPPRCLPRAPPLPRRGPGW